jgi:copper resistance protein C
MLQYDQKLIAGPVVIRLARPACAGPREDFALKTSTLFAMVALLALSTATQAHTHLKESTPANNSVVNAAPSNVVLKFSGAAKVTALTLHRDGEADQKLTATPATASQEVTAALPKLAPGKYRLDWRVAGADGHVMSGQLSFTVDPKAAASAGKAPAHDHAH